MHTIAVWVVVALLMVGGVEVAAAEGSKPATRLSRDLAILAAPAVAAAARGPVDAFSELVPEVIGDWVSIDAVAAGDPNALEADLLALGARETAIAGRLVSARLPIAAIGSLEGVTSLQFAWPAYHVAHVGGVTSQGDRVMRADTARTIFGLDGTGTTVGVISDSFNCLFGAAGDVAGGDLSTVTVVQEHPTCFQATDEGRAMLQIVHDVAPGAGLAFATGVGGQATFANNIRALRDAGAGVIVDDLIYLAEPMFQDGVVAQAVDEVVASGVAYFSAAGNNGRRAYEHAFVPGAFLPPGQFGGGFEGGTPHKFGSSVMQRISGPGGGTFRLVLQWDSPFFSVSGPPGTQNDLDVYLLASNGAGGFFVVASATTDNLASGDPVEILQAGCGAPPSVQCVGFIVIVNNAGANPGRFKYVLYASGGTPTLSPAISHGTIYGHANAEGAVAVGAVSYRTPTTLEKFSSGGTTPVLFDTAGNVLTPIDARSFKPEIVAPDGGDTTFFGVDTDGTGFPNFFGTSAAAPHAAGVAALLRQAVPALTPLDVRTTLETTALNLGAAGFDINTGFGLIRADIALGALHVFTITAGPSGTPNPVIPGGTVSLSVTASDSLGHGLTYAWAQTCTGLSAGAFDDATIPTPTWTAPVNTTGASRTCALKVTVRDGHGFSKVGTHVQTVLSVPRITSLAPAAASVGASLVITGTSLTGTTGVTFGGGVTVVPSVVTATRVTVAVPAGAITGPVSITTPAGTGVSTASFKILPKITGFTPTGVVAGSMTEVVVSGTNLRAATGEPSVKVGTFAIPGASAVSSTPTELRFRVPLPAVTGKISVKTLDGTATSLASLTVIYTPKPTSFAPASAAVGAVVTIRGTNLMAATDVTFTGGVSAVPTAVTATSLQVMVPAGTLTGPVTVTNPAGTAATTASLKVLPRITAFTPASVVAGSVTVVTVDGTNLMAATGTPTVKVGAFAIPAGQVFSTPTQITFTVPLGAVTGKISVKTLDGTATSASNLIVMQPPKPTGFAPASAAVGAALTINGTNLTGTTQVTFTGGVSVPPTAVTATSVRVVVPPGALTGPVTVTNLIGTGTSGGVFRVLPKITSFSPPSGAVGGQIVVTGTNLKTGAGHPVVKVGTVVAVVDDSSLAAVTFTIPPGAVTGRISLTTADGTAVSATSLVVTP
jgi:hypothetical protein